MKLLETNRQGFLDAVNQSVPVDESVVRRYLDAVRFEDDETRDINFKSMVKEASIREGARIVPCFKHQDVEVFVLDDQCVTLVVEFGQGPLEVRYPLLNALPNLRNLV